MEVPMVDVTESEAIDEKNLRRMLLLLKLSILMGIILTLNLTEVISLNQSALENGHKLVVASGLGVAFYSFKYAFQIK